jgi:hypothetical protein
MADRARERPFAVARPESDGSIHRDEDRSTESDPRDRLGHIPWMCGADEDVTALEHCRVEALPRSANIDAGEGRNITNTRTV